MSSASSVQRDLDRFYKSMDKSDFSIRKVTKGAFTQARAKLNPEAFKRLNQVAIDTFYEQNLVYTWHGMRTLAVDGTSLMLPNHQSVKDEFGVHKFGPKADKERSLARTSLLYDVLNLMVLDAQMASFDTSEKELLHKHLDKLKPDDLLLMDRGYPSKALFFLLMAKKIHFCTRMKEDWWLELNKFKKSNKTQEIVSFKLPKKDRYLLKDFPQWQDTEIKCRLIKIILSTGETEVLCTSLSDMEKYPYDDFSELYHYRWNEEEAFKMLKCRVEVEDFSGKTAKSVRQDFYAKTFLLTLCAAYAHPIDEKVRAEFKANDKRIHDQKINRTSAVAMTREMLIPALIRHEFTKAIAAFDDIVAKTREIIRPNRSMPRNHRQKIPYTMNYKKL
jgi:Transposase DDE domain